MQVELPDLETTLNIGPGRLLDDDEFFEFCTRNRELRIEREPSGEIVIMPPAGGETGYRNNEIAFQLTYWAKADRRGVVLDCNTEFILPDGSARAPDAAWVLQARLAGLTREQREKFLPLCPDFVFELISPSDRLTRVMAKMDQWIANGASLGWLIDTRRRTVYIYRPGTGPEELHDPEFVLGEGPVAGFRLELAEIWQGLP